MRKAADDIDKREDLEKLSLKELFLKVKERGCRINNLFHRMDGCWQANLRRADGLMFYSFGWGVTPESALVEAIGNIDPATAITGRARSPGNPDPAEIGITANVTGEPNPAPPESPAQADSPDDLIG